jgi:hypothetical protein
VPVFMAIISSLEESVAIAASTVGLEVMCTGLYTHIPRVVLDIWLHCSLAPVNAIPFHSSATRYRW